jgi:hypothetical protein
MCMTHVQDKDRAMRTWSKLLIAAPIAAGLLAAPAANADWRDQRREPATRQPAALSESQLLYRSVRRLPEPALSHGDAVPVAD